MVAGIPRLPAALTGAARVSTARVAKAFVIVSPTPLNSVNAVLKIASSENGIVPLLTGVVTRAGLAPVVTVGLAVDVSADPLFVVLVEAAWVPLAVGPLTDLGVLAPLT
jgi:hypothetical protein